MKVLNKLLGASLLFLLVGVVFSQPELEVRNPVREYKIEKINLSGLRSIDSNRVLKSLAYSKGDELVLQILKEKTRASIKSLYDLGWFEDIQVDMEFPDTLPGVLLFYTFKERPTLGTLELKGLKKLTQSELKDKITLVDGQLFGPADLDRVRQSILSHYREEGFLLAEAKIEQKENSKTGKIDVVLRIDEGKKVKVKDIEFTGNTAFKDRKLAKALTTKQKSWFFGVGGEFKEEEFDTGLDSLIFFYQTQGYLDASVEAATRKYSTDKRFISLEIQVKEGIHYKLGSVTFVHNDIYTTKALESQMTLKKGESADIVKLMQSKYQIESLYRDIGYLFVQVQEEKKFVDSTLHLTYTIEENSIAHVRKVQIRGNTKTRDKVIRREVRIFPGDVFSQSLVLRSHREIMQLNFFDEVRPNYEPVSQEDVDLVFDVKEREAGTGTFSAGAAFSARDNLVFTLALQIPNLFGRGQRADVSLEFGQRKQLYSLGFTEPWFLDTPTSVGGSIFWQRLQNYYYDSDRPELGSEHFKNYGFRLRLGRRLKWPDDYFSIYTNYNFTQNENGRSRLTELSILQSGLESSLGVTLVRDDKDLPIFPNEGSRYSFTYTRTGGPLGGTFDYNTYEAKIQWWFPLLYKLVLEVESELGVVDGDNIQQVDLYQMGGMLGFQGKLRGYLPGSIGSEEIGRSFFSFVTQLRYPVAANIFYIIAFYDMGNVFGDVPINTYPVKGSLASPWSEIDLGNLLKDYGAGVRINIPMVGIMGFDFGWQLSGRTKNGREIAPSGMQFNFVIEAPF